MASDYSHRAVWRIAAPLILSNVTVPLLGLVDTAVMGHFVSPLVSVWSFLYDGIYVGATRAREMRNTMLISTFGVFLPAWYVLRPWGNHGLWAAFILFMAAGGLTMHWVYLYLQRRGTFVPTALDSA